MTRVSVVVTVDVGSDWADPHNVAERVVGVALSGDPKGIHLPHTLVVSDGALPGAGILAAQVVAVEYLASAVHSGTIRLVTAPPLAPHPEDYP